MKKILSLLLCAVLLFSLAACGGATPADGKTVITTFYPIYIFTSNLLSGIGGVKAVNMTENQGGCLHDYRLMPGDMKLLADGDAIVINGAGMEGFLDKIIKNEPNLPVIDSSENIEVICGEEHEDEEEHHSHEHHHAINSHIWLSVPNAQKQVMNIAAGLCSVFPEFAEGIKANEAAYLARLTALDSEIRAELEGCRNAKFISFHKAYDYLAAEYGITFSASVETDDGAEPGTRELAALSKMIPETGVSALFTEPDYQGSSADILAAETHVPVYVLNPVIRGDGSLTSYEDIMRSNSEIIRKAAKNHES